MLLDKIPSELIALDPTAILKVDKHVKPRRPQPKDGAAAEAAEAQAEAQAGEREEEADGEAGGEKAKFEPRNRTRGRMQRHRRKQITVIDARQRAYKEKMDKIREQRQHKREGTGGPPLTAGL